MKDFSLYENNDILISDFRTKNLSWNDLGDMLGVSQQQVSRYEQGKTELTLVEVNNIATMFNMSTWDFIKIIHFMNRK